MNERIILFIQCKIICIIYPVWIKHSKDTLYIVVLFQRYVKSNEITSMVKYS